MWRGVGGEVEIKKGNIPNYEFRIFNYELNKIYFQSEI